jgi:excisionase family DNA binding protein
MDSSRRTPFRFRESVVQIEPRWLDARRAADYISVTLDALYHMVQRRQIPFVLKGRRLFFDRLALDQWMSKDALDGTQTTR